MRYSIFLPALIFVFCHCENPQDQTLVLNRPASLRDAPGPEGRELQLLEKGQKVTDLGEVSNFETQFDLEGTTYQSPWIKVRVSGQETGWLLAAAAKPAGADHGKAAFWLVESKIQCYFGKSLKARYLHYLTSGQPADASDLAARYREAVALRDTFMHLLARRAEPNEAAFRPDFSWLETVLPGFVFQYIAEDSRPYLFADYAYWRERALKTGGDEDDVFVETCLTAFAADSIESFFPAWKFQYSDYEAASQLGAGVHLKMFRQIEKALQAGPLFRPELLEFKAALLEDILSADTRYWQPRDRIVQELGQILAAGFSFLDQRDLIALEARLKVLENPEANAVEVDLRSGK